MGTAVKKTISLPLDLAKDAEAFARAEGKTLSAVIQDALRLAGIERRFQELRDLQGYWSRQARAKAVRGLRHRRSQSLVSEKSSRTYPPSRRSWSLP